MLHLGIKKESTFVLLFMDCLGVSSAQSLQALSALLSTQEEDNGDEECKVR